jgi:hypothetical protein
MKAELQSTSRPKLQQTNLAFTTTQETTVFERNENLSKAPQAATAHAGNNSSTPRKKTQQLPSIITTAKQKS